MATWIKWVSGIAAVGVVGVAALLSTANAGDLIVPKRTITPNISGAQKAALGTAIGIILPTVPAGAIDFLSCKVGGGETQCTACGEETGTAETAYARRASGFTVVVRADNGGNSFDWVTCADNNFMSGAQKAALGAAVTTIRPAATPAKVVDFRCRRRRQDPTKIDCVDIELLTRTPEEALRDELAGTDNVGEAQP